MALIHYYIIATELVLYFPVRKYILARSRVQGDGFGGTASTGARNYSHSKLPKPHLNHIRIYTNIFAIIRL
ncbi:hypothetical protein GGR27_003806 [Lewinella antarctica]|uniref:Uncharacterized protein n=1 Tax=Neolewinella antarctica TaxID=442734 RepID=A0ABX0XG45_9BACT|nr:hypothetical protein [Neolewinella antarctica]